MCSHDTLSICINDIVSYPAVQYGRLLYCPLLSRSRILLKDLLLFFRQKERRNAAFELASLAASGEENKQRILAEDGYGLLILSVVYFLSFYFHSVLILF